jgi:WD40 repeat protein
VRELPYTSNGNSGISAIVAHPDGKHLATCGRDTRVRIWQLADGKLVKDLGKTREPGAFGGSPWLHAISLSADGLWLAAADVGGLIQVGPSLRRGHGFAAADTSTSVSCRNCAACSGGTGLM